MSFYYGINRLLDLQKTNFQGFDCYRSGYLPAYSGGGAGFSGVFLSRYSFSKAIIIDGCGGGAGKSGGT